MSSIRAKTTTTKNTNESSTFILAQTLLLAKKNDAKDREGQNK